ncbi:hypothetical protein GCM10028819_44770 [Spirosoma humi]
MVDPAKFASQEGQAGFGKAKAVEANGELLVSYQILFSYHTTNLKAGAIVINGLPIGVLAR